MNWATSCLQHWLHMRMSTVWEFLLETKSSSMQYAATCQMAIHSRDSPSNLFTGMQIAYSTLALSMFNLSYFIVLPSLLVNKNIVIIIFISTISICFLNLVMTVIGIYSKHSEEFSKMLKDLNIDNTAATYISTKLKEICIRSSYYIFCMRTKEWTGLDLMNF